MTFVDNRGTWKSDGDVVIGCTEEGKDGYDMIEWVAKQPWCNGKVTMAGNSYLAMTQWFTGAQKPPHLACLAPWEGWSDLYNDTVRRGGNTRHISLNIHPQSLLTCSKVYLIQALLMVCLEQI
jgi:putative CocE/NonD family hydrolase